MNDIEQTPRIQPLRIVLSTALLVGLGFAGYLTLRSPTGAEDAAGGSGVAEAAPATDDADVSVEAPRSIPVPVVTAPATRRELTMQITAIGNAEATRELELSASGSGDVTAVAVTEGQVVQAGDLLVAFDDTELRLAVQRARESLVTAVANFSENVTYLKEYGGRDASELEAAAFGSLIDPEAFRTLIHDRRFDELFQSITRDEVMAARDNLLTQQANYEQAERDLARANVTAPFAGQVSSLDVVVGERVSAGSPLLALVDANPIRIRVGVLESEAGLVRVGRRADISFAAYPGEQFVGRVEAISPVVDPEEKTLSVLVSLPNDALRLKPGMFAQITLDTQIFEERLLVPAAAVLLRDERPMVFRVINGRSDWIYIRKGLENDEWVEVLEGIEPGDEIIVSGHYSLAHDAAVRVVEPESEAAGR